MHSSLNKLARLLVHYSAAVKPGDFVLIQGEDITLPWINEVAKEALKAGAHVETIVELPEVREALLKTGSEEQLLHEHLLQKYALEKADVWLTAWGTKNTRANSNISAENLRLAMLGAYSYRTIYSQRVGDGSLRWCGTQYPTQADAQEACMSLSEYEAFVYGAGLLDYEDPVREWQRIHAEQERWVEYLNKKKELHILSSGTNIRVKIEGRKWINCDGKENFPDGEIFTSPLEDGIDGHISFSFPGIFMGKEIEGIQLDVERGKVVSAQAEKGEELLLALLDTDQGSRFFGEVAIGTNYNIQQFTRNMLFDEKIGGTIHMAIGDAPAETGGLNRSVIHWDMLCDMRDEGKLYADGQLFYENGQFLESVLDAPQR